MAKVLLEPGFQAGHSCRDAGDVHAKPIVLDIITILTAKDVCLMLLGLKR